VALPSALDGFPVDERTTHMRLNVLIIEDRPEEAESIVSELERIGFDVSWKRVETEDGVLTALSPDIDLVFSDSFVLDSCAMDFVRLIHGYYPALPVIVVTHAIGEDLAVACMRAGAADYVLRERMEFLQPAVQRAQKLRQALEEQQRTSAALKEANTRFDRLVENLQDVIFRYRLLPTPGCEYVSSVVTQISGYTPEEFYADPNFGWNLIHPDDRGLMANFLKLRDDEEMRRPLILRWVKKDGQTVWTSQRNVPIRNADGELAVLEGVARDVTEQRLASLALAESNAKLTAIINSAPRAIITLNKEGNISEWNPTAARMFGWTAEEVIGGPLPIFRGDMAERAEQFRQRAHNGETVTAIETLALRKSGAAIAIGFSVAPLRDHNGRLIGSMVMAADFTARKAAEALAKQQNQRLLAVHPIEQAVASSMDLGVVLDVLLDQVLGQLGVDAADVLLQEQDGLSLRYAAGRGFKSPKIQSTWLRIGEEIAGVVALERRPFSVSMLNGSKPATARSYLREEEGFTSYYGLPLISKGEIKGVLEMFTHNPLTVDEGWQDFAETLASQAAVAIEQMNYFEGMQRANFELRMAYDATLEGWSKALDLRGNETQGHFQEVAEIAARLARTMGMAPQDIVHLRRGALLHDIGEMSIPDAILLKPGPLTDEEMAIMRQHPSTAYEFLSDIVYLRPAVDIPYCHHEHWDGSGYPRGLKGKRIPWAARIFAVVDAWYALTSDRSYRAALPEAKAREILLSLAGVHYDPSVVDAFLPLKW